MNQNLRLKLLGFVFCLGIFQFTNAQTLISLNKTTTASTTEGTYNASFATDASGTIFWSSQSADYKQWPTVYLGQNCDVDKLQINFADGRLAVTFDILFSLDGITFNVVRTIPPTVPLGSGEDKGKPVTNTYTINSGSFSAPAIGRSGGDETSITKTDLGTATLYPNPVINRVNVAGVSDRAIISVYDVSGRMNTSTVGTGIDVSGLSKGIYVLKINDQGKIITKKFIKE